MGVRNFITTLIFFWLIYSNSYAVDLTGLLNSHDPATLAKDGDTYWHFTTGTGIWSSVSTNLSHWTASNKPVFPVDSWPSWINSFVPDFGGVFWAPDVIFMNNAYYLYYSCSTWGSTLSVIGVARSASLNNPSWEDLGPVVYSNGLSTDINAIDPGMFRDEDGKIYMTYGSWFGGIGIVEIDSITGTAQSGTTHIYGGDHQSIEASVVIKKDNYYYLIVNRGNCCDGVSSTYYITAGRSTNVFGPYDEFRTILSTDGKYIGPGHFGLLQETCGNFVSVHYYDGNDNGDPKLDILKMKWINSWPELTREFSFDDCPLSVESHGINSFDESFEIYPNPAHGKFSIKPDNDIFTQSVEVNIFDLQGRKLFSRHYRLNKKVTVEPGLKPGMYIVKIGHGEKLASKRIVVQ